IRQQQTVTLLELREPVIIPEAHQNVIEEYIDPEILFHKLKTSSKFHGLVIKPPQNKFVNGLPLKNKIQQLPSEMKAKLMPIDEKLKPWDFQRNDPIANEFVLFLFKSEKSSEYYCLSWSQVEKYRLAKTIPKDSRPDLFPKKKNLKPFSEMFHWSSNREYLYHERIPFTKIHAGLISIFKDKTELETQVFFGIPDEHSKNLALWPLKKVKWKVEDTEATQFKIFFSNESAKKSLLVIEPSYADEYMFLNGSWNPSREEFTFHNRWKNYDLLFQRPDLQDILSRNPTLEENDPSFSRSWCCYSNPEMCWVYQILRDSGLKVETNIPVLRYKKNQVQFELHLHRKFETQIIDKDSSHSELNSDDYTCDLHLRLATETEDFKRISAPHLRTDFLNSIDGGLARHPFFQDVTATSNRLKRPFEMKFLRHSGIAAYAIFETLHWALTNKTLDQKENFKKADLIEHILQNCVYFLRKTTEEFDELSQVLTDHLLGKFKKFLNSYLQKIESSVTYMQQNTDCIREVELELKEYYALFTAQYLALMTSEKPNEIKKMNTSIWADHSRPSFLVNHPLTTEYVYSLISYLMALSKTSIVLLDGQKIQSFNSFDLEFKIKFQNSDRSEKSNKSNRDWFALHPSIFFQGKEISIDQVSSLKSGQVFSFEDKLYFVPQNRLPKMKSLIGFWDRIFRPTGKRSLKIESQIHQIPRNRFLELFALEKMGVTIEGNQDWEEIKTYFENMNQRRKLSTWIQKAPYLKDYQKIGVQWMTDLFGLKIGGILADDMGLGKTLQTLTFLQYQLKNKKIKNCLIVMPPSLIHNWQSEIQKFFPDLENSLFRPAQTEIDPQKISGLQLMTYGLMAEHIEKLEKINWDFIVFDEAHYLKNLISHRATAARKMNAEIKLALTGTPLENSYEELFSLIDLVLPGSLGSFSQFKMIYGKEKTVETSDIHSLKSIIQPIILRRTKSDVQLELPDKIESVVNLDLEPNQKILYKNTALSMNADLVERAAETGIENNQLRMFTALMRLRQICSDPRNLKDLNYTNIPPKIEYLASTLEQILVSNESALVFSQFLTTLHNLESALKSKGLKTYLIEGSIPTEKRRSILQEFEKDTSGAVLLMTLKTGGVGLNLTKASYVFHIEPWWNPAVENQATDRAHRIGQTKTVNVYRLILKETLEEKIQALKVDKQKRFDSIFADTDVEPSTNPTLKSTSKIPAKKSVLTQEDFKYLLNIKD
ncbi:MAG: DEAD/DEAH box helicase, partial [Pseudobdellovibrionaceae bacterium]